MEGQSRFPLIQYCIQVFFLNVRSQKSAKNKQYVIIRVVILVVPVPVSPGRSSSASLRLNEKSHLHSEEWRLFFMTVIVYRHPLLHSVFSSSLLSFFSIFVSRRPWQPTSNTNSTHSSWIEIQKVFIHPLNLMSPGNALCGISAPCMDSTVNHVSIHSFYASKAIQ